MRSLLHVCLVLVLQVPYIGTLSPGHFSTSCAAQDMGRPPWWWLRCCYLPLRCFFQQSTPLTKLPDGDYCQSAPPTRVTPASQSVYFWIRSCWALTSFEPLWWPVTRWWWCPPAVYPPRAPTDWAFRAQLVHFTHTCGLVFIFSWWIVPGEGYMLREGQQGYPTTLGHNLTNGKNYSSCKWHLYKQS